MLAHCYTPIVHLDPLLTPIKGRSRALVREGWPRGRTGRRIRLSLSLSPTRTLVTPYCKRIHPPWAQDNTKAAGSPYCSPPLCLVSRRPIWAGTRRDNLLVGPGTPPGSKRRQLTRRARMQHTPPPPSSFVRSLPLFVRRRSALYCSKSSASRPTPPRS
jgi:hypothetical protein